MLVDSDITQSDNITLTQATSHSIEPYAELQAKLRRELIDNRAWLGATALGRVRTGNGDYGGQASFDAAPAGFVPGLVLDGKAIAQPFDAPGKGATHRPPVPRSVFACARKLSGAFACAPTWCSSPGCSTIPRKPTTG